MFYQRTIKEVIKLEGVGLHSGEQVQMVLCPAPPDTGIVFLTGGKRIKAVCDNVGDTSYATTIHDGTTKIRTVEHLLAALAGLSIDNVYVELDGSEVPIMDGSAWPFIEVIREAGITVQGSARRYLKIIKPVTVHEGDKSATLLPSPVSRITYRIDFDHPAISDQSCSMDVEPSTFAEELAGARTFGFMKDVEMLQKAGLARGGSLENAVVMDDEHILNKEGLRYHDEFVRHKMLDAIGDLSLAGMPIIGHLVADKSGHWLNHRLVLEVLSHPDSWMVLEGEPAFEETRAYMEA